MRSISVKRAGALMCLCLLAAPLSVSAQDINSPVMDAAAIEQANARIAAVQAHINAYRTGNIDRFIATFTKDAVVQANGIEAVGHEQIKSFYALNFQPGAPKIRIHGSGISGEAVQVSIGYVFENGEEVCCSTSDYYTSGGKISFLRSDM